MKSDKKNKDCYISWICNGWDCCMCKFHSSNDPMELMTEDTACDLAIVVWEIQQSAKRTLEQINKPHQELNSHD